MHMNKYLCRLLITSLVLSIVFGLYALNYAEVSGYHNIEGLFLLVFGGIYRSESISVVQLLLFCVPQLMLVLLLAGYMYEDFRICSVYVFTRKYSRRKWFFGKSMHLLLYTAVFMLIQFMVLYLFCVLSGLTPVFERGLLLIVVWEYVALLLLNFFFILVANLLVLRLATNIGLLCTYVLYLVLCTTAFIGASAPGMLIAKANPIANAMLVWHDHDILVKFYSDHIFGFIEDFRLSFSTIYHICLDILLLIAGLIAINNADVINFEKEA